MLLIQNSNNEKKNIKMFSSELMQACPALKKKMPLKTSNVFREDELALKINIMHSHKRRDLSTQ